MDWIAPLVFAALGLLVWAAVGSADALDRDPDAWARAGYRRWVWAAQVAGFVLVPIVPFWTGYYFIWVKPRVLSAERELSRERWPQLQQAVIALDGTASTVSIRSSHPVLIMRLALPLVQVLFFGLLLALNPDFSTDVKIGLVGLYVLVLLLGFAFGRRSGVVTLAADDVVITGFRARRVPWAEVTGVFQQGAMGSRCVRIWTRDGKSYRLRAPATGIGGLGRRRFERDFHRIGQWWLAHRGQES